MEICAVLSTPNSATTSRSRPMTRWAAISKPATSKICEPMWLCRPTSRRWSAANTRRTAVHGRAAGQRQPELLVLVRGRDELVSVRLDTDGDAHQHVLHDTAAPAIASRRSISIIESSDDVPDAGLDRGDQLVDRLVVAVQRNPLGREAGVQRDGQSRRRWRRRATGLPRRPSAPPRCTGTPWRRSARARRRRTPRRSRGSASRKSSSSITNSGVPNSAAMSADR